MKDWIKENERKALTLIAQSIIDKLREVDMDERSLAEKVGTTQTSIRRLEGGETNVSAVLLIRTAKVLNMDLVELFDCIKPGSQLVNDLFQENWKTIVEGTSAMGLTKDDLEDFYTQRDLLRLMKLWPR